jgi:hypothetical protein
VQRVASTGDGIHPEKYLFHTIFPAIRNAMGVTAILTDPHVCFLRVRSDGSVRIQDCGSRCVTEHNAKAVEHIKQRPCRLNQTNPNLAYLECGENAVLFDQSANNRSYKEATTWETCSRKRKSIFSTTRWPIKWPRHLAQT